MTTKLPIMPLVKGLSTEGTYQVPPSVQGEVLEVNIAQLVPAPGANVAVDNPIDRWLSRGQQGAVRLFMGRGPNDVMLPPAWLELGAVTVYDPVDLKTSMVCRWWESDVQAAQRAAVAALGRAYDGRVPLVFIANGGTTYAEPFIRGIQSDVTRRNLLAAGYTKAADQASYLIGYEMFKGWWRWTRLAQAFNPYQYVNADGSGSVDVSFTLAMMDEFASLFPRRAVWQNNSVRTALAWGGVIPPAYQAIYDHMREAHFGSGRAVRFQTATQQRVGSFAAVLDWALRQGAHAVELTPGFQDATKTPHLSPAEMAHYDQALRAVPG